VCEMFPASPSARAIAALGERLLSDKQGSVAGSAADVSGGLKFMWQRLFREAAAAPAV
jgi:hypothetical protein